MAARRSLTLLAAVIALLVAGVGAVWLWFAMVSSQPLVSSAAATLVVLIALTFAARCIALFLGTLSREPAGASEPTGTEDVADPGFRMLRGDSARGTHDPHGAACPWCEAPLKRALDRCPSCDQAL